jgi:hypothetical protein
LIGIYFDSDTLRVGLVEHLLDTLPVILQNSSLLVELDGGLRDVGGTALSAVIQDGYLSLLTGILDADGGIYRIVVAGNVLGISNWPWEPGVIVELSILHFKTVGVCKELLVDIKIIEHLPVNSDIFTKAIFDWNFT